MNGWWRKVARRLELLRGLRSPGEVVLFVRIFSFAIAVPVLMRLDIRRLGRWLEPHHVPAIPNTEEIQQIIDCFERARRVGAPVVRGGCLTRGVTLYYFLRRAGLAVSLCFGMGKRDQGFDGHCWLLEEGEPFLERQNPEPLFKTFYCWPEGGNH
jgi:hypothetical protein